MLLSFPAPVSPRRRAKPAKSSARKRRSTPFWALAGLFVGASFGLSGCTTGSLEADLQPIGNTKRTPAPSVVKLPPPGNGSYGDSKPVDFGRRNPDLYPVHGIDISKWQGNVDWDDVRRSGISFAFLKATEGRDHADERFAQYQRDASAAGIANAPYHFYYFCTSARIYLL